MFAENLLPFIYCNLNKFQLGYFQLSLKKVFNVKAQPDI